MLLFFVLFVFCLLEALAVAVYVVLFVVATIVFVSIPIVMIRIIIHGAILTRGRAIPPAHICIYIYILYI